MIFLFKKTYIKIRRNVMKKNACETFLLKRENNIQNRKAGNMTN